MAIFKFPWPRGQKEERDPSPVRRSRSAQVESVEDMRRRARHRLIGAAVLVALGVVGFPVLFDSQPRPIPVDVPIEIPDRNAVAPLVVPGSGAQSGTSLDMLRNGTPSAAIVADAGAVADGEELVLPNTPMAPLPPLQAPVAAPAPAPQALPAPAALPAIPVPPVPQMAPERKPAPVVEKPVKVEAPKPKPEPKAEPKPEPKAKPEPKPEPKVDKPARSDEAARARALLEGAATPAPAAAAQSGRFVVQVGAFAEAGKVADVRQKLEAAGLKTFTQVVQTKDGPRTRVRVGPFSNRADADKAAARAKALGLAGAVQGS